MSRRKSSKFIPDGDSDFACMARVFADNIARDPARYQLSASDAEQVSSAVVKFREALTAAIQVGTRNKITIMRKDEARAKAERIVRKFGNIIRASSEISAIDKMLIRVKERPTRLERRECPKTPPQLMFVGTVGEASTDGARHILHFRDKFGAGTRAKPAGAARIELFVELIDPDVKVAPKHPGELSGGRPWYLRSFTRSPIEVRFPIPVTAARVVYWARWADAKGEVGPFSRACLAGVVCSTSSVGLQIEDQRDDQRRIAPMIIERLDITPLLTNDEPALKQLPEAA